MAKYGQAKYNTFKYGRYQAVKKAIGEFVRYRMGPTINKSISITGTQKVRIRSNKSPFVVCQSIGIGNDIKRVRIRTNQSNWIVSNRITLEELEQ